jgi:hypothetical protein
MIVVEPFRPDHLARMTLQPAQEYLRAYAQDAEKAIAETAKHPAYTGLLGDDVIVCAGIVPIWDGRAAGWAWLSASARRHMVAITRGFLRFLDVQPYRRVEISVDREFAEAHRWARMLGFKLEAGRMRAYRPDGGDCSLYARVRA